MKKFQFERESDELLEQITKRLDTFEAMSEEEQLADLVETGILNEDGTLADRYKAPEERKVV